MPSTTTHRSTHFATEERPAAGEQGVGVESLDTLAYHVGLVAIGIGGGIGIRTGLGLIGGQAIAEFPLFPFCLVASVILQTLVDRWDIPVDRPTVERILNTAQDAMIVAGMATLETKDLWSQGLAFLLCCVAAFIWAICAFFV